MLFNFSLNVTSNVLFFSTVAAASLIPRPFSAVLPLEDLGLGTRLGSGHSQSFASCPRDPDDYELIRLLLCFALVRCSVKSRVATKQGAAFIQAHTVYYMYTSMYQTVNNYYSNVYVIV